MNESPRYRLDFIVPESYDISEDPPEGEFFSGTPTSNPTLGRLRAAMSTDSRWERSMLAPWKPRGVAGQHLIVWVDLDEEISETVIGDGVYDVVSDAIPGVTLVEVVQTPL
jgi:hypothetical protein